MTPAQALAPRPLVQRLFAAYDFCDEALTVGSSFRAALVEQQLGGEAT